MHCAASVLEGSSVDTPACTQHCQQNLYRGKDPLSDNMHAWHLISTGEGPRAHCQRASAVYVKNDYIMNAFLASFCKFV